MKNKGDSYNNEFFRCLTCKKNLCLLCRPQHETNHIVINYEKKLYMSNT